MAENFAGQWLEIRNLDSIKPDPQKFPAWGPELRDAMKTETRHVLRLDPAREPSDRRVHRRALHVPQRVPGELLRHRGRHRPGVPPRRADDRPARRRAQPRQRARRVELSDAHLGGHPRQVHPAEHPRHAAAAAAGRRAARSTRRRSAPPRRCASRWRSTARTRSARRATRAWIRSASRSRTTTRSASGGPRTAGSRSIRAACCRAARRSRAPPRCGRSSAERAAGVLARADREDADLRARPRPRALRPADGPRHHQARWPRPATGSRRSCTKSCAACRSSRAAPSRSRSPSRRSSGGCARRSVRAFRAKFQTANWWRAALRRSHEFVLWLSADCHNARGVRPRQTAEAGPCAVLVDQIIGDQMIIGATAGVTTAAASIARAAGRLFSLYQLVMYDRRPHRSLTRFVVVP